MSERLGITFPEFVGRAAGQRSCEAVAKGSTLRNIVNVYAVPYHVGSRVPDFEDMGANDRLYFVALGFNEALRGWQLMVRHSVGNADIGTYTRHEPAAPLEHVRLGVREWASGRRWWRWLLRFVRAPRMRRVDVTWREVFPAAKLHPEIGPSWVRFELTFEEPTREEPRP